MTNDKELSQVGSMVFKLKFLQTMLPSMTLTDANFFSEFYSKMCRSRLTLQDMEKLEDLYKKFEKKEPNATISETK